jgi:hypothetical protein
VESRGVKKCGGWNGMAVSVARQCSDAKALDLKVVRALRWRAAWLAGLVRWTVLPERLPQIGLSAAAPDCDLCSIGHLAQFRAGRVHQTLPCAPMIPRISPN